MSESRQQHIIRHLSALAPSEGYTLSTLAGVRFMRANSPLPRVAVLYEPSIVIVCQGRKRGFLGDAVYAYDPHHYLVLSVPLPFESDTLASADEPMLAVAISIDLAMAADLMLALDAGPQRQASASAAAGVCSTPLSEAMSDALLRLLQALGSRDDAAILGPAIVRELLYRVLTGPQGGAVQAALNQQSQFGRIGKALRRIHARCEDPVDVTLLASEAGMSIATFHTHFKAVTRTTPIQYVKTTRLHKARLLMVQDGVSAATASHLVGYESSSQFSREFKRYFGRTPVHEAAAMRHALVELPARPVDGATA